MPDFSTFTTRDVADIALQRTEHLSRLPRPIGSISFKAWARGYEAPLLLESRLRRHPILRGAWADAELEWELLAPFLPRDGSLCDIGCGHALIDLVAAKHQSGIKITLIDIERTAEKHHDWNDKGAGYASLAQAKRFLTTNGIAPNGVATCNPRRDLLPDGPFDLIISLLSAGFHYPISEYTDFALRTLKPGGALIFDMRDGTDQDLSSFSEVRPLMRRLKSARVAAIKPPS